MSITKENKKEIISKFAINDNDTVWDFINGITLSQYIKEQFNLYEFQKIIVQICGLLNGEPTSSIME